MHRLAPTEYGPIRRLYASAEPYYFPLIGAVLEGAQDGTVYANDARAPREAYVEHAFGFAQLFGDPQPGFQRDFAHYALHDRAFTAPKMRLYAPCIPAFLNVPACVPMRSERQRFSLPGGAAPALSTQPTRVMVVAADASNIADIESAFGIVHRFWRTDEDFIDGARCVLVLHDGRPAAICYAAAVADGRAEIDVLTLPDYRQRGLARQAVGAFVKRCRVDGIAPLWDCFTNNAGSVRLARSAGFAPLTAPYAFFTISKI